MPKLGQPILLALGGLGIRSIEYSDAKKAYFIIAGLMTIMTVSSFINGLANLPRHLN